MSFSATIQALNPTYETKDEAIQACYAGTSQEWKDTALAIVHEIAQKHTFFSADDVVMSLESFPELERSYSALPAVFKVAKKKGWITEAMCSCGEECKTTESMRRSNHGRRILVYRSKICYNNRYVFQGTHGGVREGNETRKSV